MEPRTSTIVYDEDKGPENLAEILGRLFAARGWARKSARTQLEAAWSAVASPDWRDETHILVIRKGVLEVEVRSPVLMQELAQFQKRKLLEQMRAQMPATTIMDIRFRAGAWS